jgi:hypothetical protein
LLLDRIPKLRKQLDELIEASMQIADNVKRAVFVLQVVPQRLAHDFRRVNLLG